MKAIKNPYANMPGHVCFGCSPENVDGLNMRFFEEGEKVVSLWTPTPRFQGYPGVLHGGIQATLLDEIASWVVYVKLQTAGVTAAMEVRYKRPVLIDRGDLRLEAWVEKLNHRLVSIRTVLFDHLGNTGSEGLFHYRVFPEQEARNRFFYPGAEAFQEEK